MEQKDILLLWNKILERLINARITDQLASLACLVLVVYAEEQRNFVSFFASLYPETEGLPVCFLKIKSKYSIYNGKKIQKKT